MRGDPQIKDRFQETLKQLPVGPPEITITPAESASIQEFVTKEMARQSAQSVVFPHRGESFSRSSFPTP